MRFRDSEFHKFMWEHSPIPPRGLVPLALNTSYSEVTPMSGLTKILIQSKVTSQQLVYKFRNISFEILSGSVGVFFSEF